MISPSEQLSELVRNSDTSLSIAEGALVIARHEYPALDVTAYLAELDDIATRIKRRLPSDAGKPHMLSLLNHCLFRELGYAGNRDNYYDPRNSLLNDVIDRRTGIPITLCILYLEIGKRLGLPLEGVAFPGHFLVKCRIDQGVIVLDPFNRGASLSEEELRDMLKQNGNEHRQPPLTALLQTADKKTMWLRLARNLKAIYVNAGQTEKAVKIITMILTINPEETGELRDRGLLYSQLECYRAALLDLERLASVDVAAAEDDVIQEKLEELRKRNRLLN